MLRGLQLKIAQLIWEDFLGPQLKRPDFQGILPNPRRGQVYITAAAVGIPGLSNMICRWIIMMVFAAIFLFINHDLLFFLLLRGPLFLVRIFSEPNNCSDL